MAQNKSYKSCSRCGKIHPIGYICNVGRKYRRHETEDARLRNKAVWANKSEQIRVDAQYLCEVCKDNGAYVFEGLEVHHIEKLRENQELFLDDHNLICLCRKHHKMADRGQISKERLRELADRRCAASTPRG